MGIWLLLGILAVSGVLVYIQRNGGFRFPWLQFYVKGKESGFRFGELNLLRRVAVENRLPNPTSLFWSEKTLDRCIRGTMIRFRSHNKEEDPAAVRFLNKLFDFRKRVEFNLPKYRLGIQSTRNIAPGQVLKITYPGSSVYISRVVENMRKYLAVGHPKGAPLPPGFSWRGQKVNVYFWRAEDAGYYFESKILGDYIDKKFPILHMTHADKLVRTQKRGSVRVQLANAGRVFPLTTIKEANERPEKMGGYRCKMVDLSEDGAAVLVGGRAKPGVPVKIQTELDGDTIILSGTVKGVTFKQNKNVSILHIQGIPTSPQMKNRILAYVYGIFRNVDGTPRMSSLPSGSNGARSKKTGQA
ncbi:MAG: PilZ domain-containing protein [Spirochaetaceae bacterium]|nr:MAG: PilZ domain-containing protein [Spirochaetaceae bacterium]